jgi:outer membrane cobalamin receptor
VDFPSPASAPVSWQQHTAHQKLDLYQHFLTARGNLFGDSQTDLKVQTYFHSHYQEFKDLPNGLNGIYRNRFWGAQAEIYLPFASRLITVGTNYEVRWLWSNELKNMTFHEGALYVNQTFSLSEQWQFQVLPRLELNSHFGFALLPDLSFHFQPDSNLQLGLNFQASRQVPNFFELYWRNKYFQGNSRLKSATLQTLTLDCHYQPTPWLRLVHAAYVRRVYSSIEMSMLPDASQLTFFNQRVAHFYGNEQQIEVHLGPALDFRWLLNLTFTRDEHQKSLPDRPWLTSSSDLICRQPFFEGNLKTRFYARLNLLGKRWSMSADTYPFPGYFYTRDLVPLGWEPTLDLKAEGTIGALQLFFSIENILARRYQVIAGYNIREFAILWGLEWQFLN